MALVMTLWIIALLTLVAAAVLAGARTQTNLARNLVGNAKAEGLADAGVHRAVAALLNANVAHWPRVDGTTYRWLYGDGDIEIAIQDEAGKIDLNQAADQLLVGLIVSAGVESGDARRLADAIRDFADPDNLKRPNGAEDDDYQAVGIEYGAKDRAFESVPELQQVLGITLDVYNRIGPALTVYSGNRSVDPTTAPREVLLALPGATLAQVDALMAARGMAAAAGIGGQDAESAEGGSPGAKPLLDSIALDSAADAAMASAGRSRGRHVFTVTATARTPGGGVFERQAIVRLTGDPSQPFLFQEWRQAWPSSDSGSTEDAAE
jgi:general secretion pathway protein K